MVEESNIYIFATKTSLQIISVQGTGKKEQTFCCIFGLIKQFFAKISLSTWKLEWLFAQRRAEIKFEWAAMSTVLIL